MAETIQATGRIVFHKLPESTKTYIRYSDDGGKSFTAAKPWVEPLIKEVCPSSDGFRMGAYTVNAEVGTPYTKMYEVKDNRICNVELAPCKGPFAYSVSDGYSLFFLFYNSDKTYNGKYEGWLTASGEIDDHGQAYIAICLKRNDDASITDVNTFFSTSNPSVLCGEYGNGRNIITGYGSRVKEINLNNGLNQVFRIASINKAVGGHIVQMSCKIEFINCEISDKSQYWAQANNTNEWGWGYGAPYGSIVANGVVDYHWASSLKNATKDGVLDIRFDYIKGTVRISEPCVTIGDTRYPYSPAPEDQQFGLTPGRYMGVAVSDKPYPPMLVEDYTWQEVKGRGVTSITKYFTLTNSAAVKPTGAGSLTTPTMTAENRYLWCKEVTQYDDGQSITGDWYITGVFGEQGPSGSDAISIQLDKQSIIVDTDNNGQVGAEQLKEAYATLFGFKGATKQSTYNTKLIGTSMGITARLGLVTVDSGSYMRVYVDAVGIDPTTSMAYGSGWIDVETSLWGGSFKTRIPVGTNIHKSFAKFKVDNDSAIKNITASVETAKQDAITGAKNYTDGRFQILGDAITSKVSQTEYNANNTEVKRQLSEITQTADNIRLSVSSRGGANLLSDAGFVHGLTPFGNLYRWRGTEFMTIEENGANGMHSVDINCSGLTKRTDVGTLWKIQAEYSGDYTFSFYSRCLGQGDDALGEVNVLDAEDNRIKGFYSAPLTHTDWGRNEIHVEIPEDFVIDGKKVVTIQCTFYVMQNGHYQFSCPQLERGTVATAFSLSQQDRLTELGIYDDRIEAKTNKFNFTGLDGFPYIQVLHDDYGIPHLIFYKPDHTIGIDYGWNGIKEMISQTTPASWSNPFKLYSSNGFNSNNVISLSNGFNAYKYTASRAVNNGNMVLGSDGDFDDKWYDNNPAINPVNYQFIVYLSDPANLVPDGTYYQLGDGFKVTQSGVGAEFTSIDVYPLFIVSFQSGKKTSMSSAGYVKMAGTSGTLYQKFTDYQAILRTRVDNYHITKQ